MDRDDADEALVRAAREGGGDDELAAQLHALRDELTAPASSQTRWNHLAAMREAAADSTVALPVDETTDRPVEETVATATPFRRRHRAAVLVAAATVGVVGVTGGLAAAGRLPAAAQDRVADIVKVVGIDLPKHDDAHDVGPGNGREILRTTTPRAGASGTVPPVGPRGPGATGTLPGSSGSAPGHSSSGPGNSENAPGHTKHGGGDTATTPPGESENPPGRSGDGNGNDGNGNGNGNNGNGNNGNGNNGNGNGNNGNGNGNKGNGNASGHTGSPGNSGNAPGHTGSTGNNGKSPGVTGSNGKSANAPGQNKDSIAPGNSGNAPGRIKKTAGSSSVQGTDQ